MNYPQLAAEILRSLRGRRSQTAFSRRLGYKSNVAYRWENCIAFPTAASALQAAQLVGVDVGTGLRAFHGGEPTWLNRVDPASPAGVGEFVVDLVGTTPIGEVARRCGRSRFAVSRWLKGDAEPKLPELLLLVDSLSQRLLDFLTVFTDPAKLPSAAAAWVELQTAREAAYSSPWSQAILRVLEIEDYRALPRHVPGWIAARLGISLEAEEQCLSLLADSRQICRKKRWEIDQTRIVDTKTDPKRSEDVRTFWTEVAVDRVRHGHVNQGNYAVFSLSELDLAKVAALHREFYERVRAVVTQSEPSERVVLMTNFLVALETPKQLARLSFEQPLADGAPRAARRRSRSRVGRSK